MNVLYFRTTEDYFIALYMFVYIGLYNVKKNTFHAFSFIDTAVSNETKANLILLLSPSQIQTSTIGQSKLHFLHTKFSHSTFIAYGMKCTVLSFDMVQIENSIKKKKKLPVKLMFSQILLEFYSFGHCLSNCTQGIRKIDTVTIHCCV